MRDVLSVAGLILIGVGCWLVYPPAGLIVVGALLLAAGIGGHLRDS
jgi:hypothetical protein